MLRLSRLQYCWCLRGAEKTSENVRKTTAITDIWCEPKDSLNTAAATTTNTNNNNNITKKILSWRTTNFTFPGYLKFEQLSLSRSEGKIYKKTICQLMCFTVLSVFRLKLKISKRCNTIEKGKKKKKENVSSLLASLEQFQRTWQRDRIKTTQTTKSKCRWECESWRDLLSLNLN